MVGGIIIFVLSRVVRGSRFAHVHDNHAITVLAPDLQWYEQFPSIPRVIQVIWDATYRMKTIQQHSPNQTTVNSIVTSAVVNDTNMLVTVNVIHNIVQVLHLLRILLGISKNLILFSDVLFHPNGTICHSGKGQIRRYLVY